MMSWQHWVRLAVSVSAPGAARIASSASSTVMVDDRIFVRSWSVKPQGWYRTFLAYASAHIQIARREIPVRAVHTRSEALKKAVDRAFLAKYCTGWEVKYAKDLVSAKSRAATIELVPIKVLCR
jgi:hypothetical protein